MTLQPLQNPKCPIPSPWPLQNDTSATAKSLASAISEGSAQAVANTLANAYALGGASAEATSAAIAEAYNEDPGKIAEGISLSQVLFFKC